MKIIYSVLLFCNLGQAGQIFWVNLRPSFTYMDLSTACSNDSMKRFWFGAEVSDGKVQKAVLRENTVDVLARRIDFLPDESLGVQLYLDKVGRTWLKTLPLSGRVLAWILAYGDGMGECRPSQNLITMEPIPYPFTFSTDGLGESVLNSSTQTAKLSGKRKDGGGYEAKIELTQTQFDVRHP